MSAHSERFTTHKKLEATGLSDGISECTATFPRELNVTFSELLDVLLFKRCVTCCQLRTVT